MVEKTLFFKPIIGIITSLLVGWAFLWLIATYFHVAYWIIFVSAVLIANFFPILYYEILSPKESRDRSKEEREFDIELMSFFIAIFAFGIEGIIIAFYYDLGAGFIGVAFVVLSFVLSRMYKEPAAVVLVCSLFLAIPGYLLGLFWGWTLGFLGMIHFIAALASVIIIALLDSIMRSDV